MAGWGWPLLSRKAHYFSDDGRSLCLRWLFMGATTEPQAVGPKPGPDDCASCHKRLVKQRSK